MAAIDNLLRLVAMQSDCRYRLWEYDPKPRSQEYHPGVDVYADAAYSCSAGTVVAIGTNGESYDISIMQDANTMFRYCNLATADVRLGSEVQVGFRIGNTDSFVHFEYCTRDKEDSIWVVRVGTEQYYKHDPLTVF